MVHTVTRRHPRRPPAASEHSSTRVHGCSRTASSSKSKCLHKGQQHRAARKLNFLLRDGRTSAAWRRLLAAQRSEEHTSELQSLMRISYAVFCLKKKNTQSLHAFIEQPHITTRHAQKIRTMNSRHKH